MRTVLDHTEPTILQLLGLNTSRGFVMLTCFKYDFYYLMDRSQEAALVSSESSSLLLLKGGQRFLDTDEKSFGSMNV